MTHQILARSLLFGALATTVPALVETAPAQAFSWSETSQYVTLDKGDFVDRNHDKPYTFWVDFNQGYVDGTLANGLTSRAVFTLLEAFDGQTAQFRIDLSNTSILPITQSRVSILGWDVDQTLAGVNVTDNGTDGNNGDRDGVFTRVGAGQTSQPKFSGDLDLCVKAGGGANNCTGAGGDGAWYRTVNGNVVNETLSFTAALRLASMGNSMTFRNFHVRYQSIDGTIAGREVKGASGIGVGNVPTPALIPGAIGMGIAALRKKKAQEESEESKDLSQVS